MARRIGLVDGEFVIEFAYNRALVDEVKLIPGRRWDGPNRCWRAPATSAPAVKVFATQHGLDVDPGAGVLLDQVEHGTEYHLFVDESARALIYRAGYHAEVVAAIRTVEGRRWYPETKEWTIPASEADRLIDIVERFGVAVHPAARPILLAWGEDAERLRAMSRAAAADLVVPGLAPGMDLLPYQKAGVLYARAAGWRCFIADQPGLGKTVQALAACEIAGRWPAVVVCPTVVETFWQREIERFFPHRRARALRGRSAVHLGGPLDEPVPDYLVVGYPVVADWLNALLEVGPQALVVDESHYLKGAKTLRTKAVKALAGVGTRDRRADTLRGAVPVDGVVLLLTGTPILNRTVEIVEQIAVLGRLGDLGGWPRFTRRYVKIDNLTAEAQNDRRRELNEHLRATMLVRRLKEEVLTELPAKRRSFVWIAPDPAVMADYRLAERNVLAFLAARAREVAAELGLDPEHEAVQARLRARGAEALVRIGVLRQLAARAKLPAAVEWARAFLDSGEALGIYAHHRDIVATLAAALSGRTIQGGQTAKERQAVIDAFQAGECQVAVLSIAAAGVGITLTAASNALFVEQAWNPGTLTQAEDRHHRIGQTDSVTAFYLLAEGTIDEDLMDLVEAKRSETDHVLDGRNVESWAEGDDPAVALAATGSVAGELIARLTRRALDVEAAGALV